MKTLALILAVAITSVGFAGISSKNPATGPTFKVHGRLSVYCGNPSCRIWIVGTKRILGVAESDPPEAVLMPAKLRELFAPERLIFGDFTVLPLTKDEAGVMRMVRVISAENIVIADDRLQFIRRVVEDVADEPGLRGPLRE